MEYLHAHEPDRATRPRVLVRAADGGPAPRRHRPAHRPARFAGRADDDSCGSPCRRWSCWSCPLFARRRFPFAAAGCLLGPGRRDHVRRRGADRVGRQPRGRSGLASALLLGYLRDRRKALIGLGIVVASMLIVIWNIPGHAADEPVHLHHAPVRRRLDRRASRCGREPSRRRRPRCARSGQRASARSAARIAVAEERARIARELHDVVAHAVSVMVLQVGAVRHKLPDSLAEDRDALQERRARRPDGAGRDAPSPGRHAPRGRRGRVRPAARPRRPERAAGRSRPRRPAGPSCTSTASPSRSLAGSTSPPTASSRRA